MTQKRVIVTGASRGIGQVLSQELAARGYDLLLSARSKLELERLARELRGSAGHIATASVDLADPEGPRRLIEAAHEALGGVDVVVNNAAVELQRRFENLSWREIERVVRVDLLAPIEVSHLVLPEMRAQGYGRLIFISSLAGRVGFPFSEAYAASKDGVIAFSRVLRNDYRGTGVSASAIILGPVRDTGLGQRTIEETGIPTSTAFMVKPQRVVKAVVKAIEHKKKELVVMKGPGRLMWARTSTFPGMGGVMNRASGVEGYMSKVADFRERTIDQGHAGAA